uniref:Methyltransferase type 11 domain-containing protein n=1 Tax=Kalanchoe fedtschenkoi TaxID=63787 RepID=A0A7N0UM42_KALFE
MAVNFDMNDESSDDGDGGCYLGAELSPFGFQMSASGVLSHIYALVFPLLGSVRPIICAQNENATLAVFKEIMNDGLLDDGAKAICIGEGSTSAVSALHELGFRNALNVADGGRGRSHHSNSNYGYELDYEDNSFDFVFSRVVDRISVPALLVLEIERVLRPGGAGAMIVGSRNLYSGGLIRSATHISAYLKSSDVVNVRAVGSFTLVMFKKRFDKVSAFEHFRLPDVCPSVTTNKRIMHYLEPVVRKPQDQSSTSISYVPKFMNISSRGRLVYINIGAGEYVNSSTHNWLKPLYPMRPRAPHVYVIDHNVSVLASYIKSPGVTFIYHPGLAGAGLTDPDRYASVGEMGERLEDEGFDFVEWFKETVTRRDFVILAMNARAVELKLLFELYESGAICHVDELFLRCSDGVDCKTPACGDCASLYLGLRNSGVYVHQWFGN